MSPEAQNMKIGRPLVLPKMTPGAQNMKTGPVTLDSTQNESGSVSNFMQFHYCLVVYQRSSKNYIFYNVLI
jgi:hypothetical protein